MNKLCCFRVLSSYLNKIVESSWYLKRTPLLYNKMLNYTKLSPLDVENIFMANRRFHANGSSAVLKLRKVHCPKTPFLTPSDGFEPSFRGYVVAIAFEKLLQCSFTTESKQCISQQEDHHRGYMSNCAPCDIRYDGIIQVSRKLPSSVNSLYYKVAIYI